MAKLLSLERGKKLCSILNRLDCTVLHFTTWQVLLDLVLTKLDFAIHTLAIDNELSEQQRMKRIQEVHSICEQFKYNNQYRV